MSSAAGRRSPGSPHLMNRMEVPAMAEYIDRKQIKSQARALLRDAQVPPRAFFALYLSMTLLLDLAASLATGDSDMMKIFAHPLGLFVVILVNLLGLILGVGVYLYCFAIRRGERSEYLTLFDGFSFTGKILLLYAVEYLFVILWCCLLIVPGVVAGYRYRFAVLNLCENPSLGVMEAIDMSKRQTYGYKGQLFALDVSYLAWILLANVGTIYFDAAYQLSVWGAALPGLSMAAWLQTLIGDAITVAVGIFYLPSYHLSNLSYFDAAKHSSGVGAGLVPRDPGPDDLGGF